MNLSRIKWHEIKLWTVNCRSVIRASRTATIFNECYLLTLIKCRILCCIFYLSFYVHVPQLQSVNLWINEYVMLCYKCLDKQPHKVAVSLCAALFLKWTKKIKYLEVEVWHVPQRPIQLATPMREGQREPGLLRVFRAPLSLKLSLIIGLILMTMLMVLSSWRGHCESSSGSFDECRLSARWPPTLKPSQTTWLVSPPVGCYQRKVYIFLL